MSTPDTHSVPAVDEALADRFQLKAFVESCLVLEEGIAGVRDIDLGMMMGTGMIPGPFARADFRGLDDVLAALEKAEQEWGEHFEPPLILRRLVAQGRLGAKSGQGFYPYPQPDEGYENYGAADVFDVWNDVARRYRLNPDWTVTTGYSMGGVGSFKLGNLLFCGDNIYKDSCVGVIDAHHGSNIPAFLRSLERIARDDSEFLLPSHGPVFRRDNAVIQRAIDRLTQYQHMADFGTCAVDWPLLDEWEADVVAGRMPKL